MSKPALKFFKFWIADFLEGTRLMTASETGDYIRLLAFIYDQGGAVPNDPYVLRHLLQRCTKLCDATKRVQRLVDLGKLGVDGAGKLHNGRADREIGRIQNIEKKGGPEASDYPSHSRVTTPQQHPKTQQKLRARAFAIAHHSIDKSNNNLSSLLPTSAHERLNAYKTDPIEVSETLLRSLGKEQ